MLFPLALLNLHRACAAESTRYAMTGVLFERTADGNCRAVATDAKLSLVVDFAEPPDPSAVAATLETDLGIGGPGSAKIIPATALAAMDDVRGQYSGPKPRGPHAGWVALNAGDTFRLAAEFGCGRVAVEGKCIEGRFPPWQEILPKENGKTADESTFDPAKVAQLITTVHDVLGLEARMTVRLTSKGVLFATAESLTKEIKATAMLMNLPNGPEPPSPKASQAARKKVG